MAQLQKGFEYSSSNNIATDDNLNGIVGNATLLDGAITEQASNSTSEDTDVMVLSKAGSLIKQTKVQFAETVNSNIVNVNTVNAGLVDSDNINAVNATVTGTFASGGNSTLSGNSALTGNLTSAGSIAVSGTLTSSGTANFTGALQVNGAVGYVLAEIYEETIPFTVSGGSQNNIWTSAIFVKPVGEFWVFEIYMQHTGYPSHGRDLGFRYGSQPATTGNYLFIEQVRDGTSTTNTGDNTCHFFANWTLQPAITMTDTIKLDETHGLHLSIGNDAAMQRTSTLLYTATLQESKFRIYKYKTA